MAASYPAGYDVMSDPAPNLSGPPLHSTMHNQINDVLEAIEAELGLNPSGADATVAALLAALPARYVSGTSGAGAPSGTGTSGHWYYDTTNKRTYQSDGVGWIIMYEPEQTYTPTLTGVTLGTATQVNSGFFRRSNGLITLRTFLQLGTGGLFTSTPTVALPAGITAGTVANGQVGAHMYDVAPSALQFQGVGECSAGLIYPRNSAVNGTNVVTTYSTASTPFTWAVGDTLSFFGTFPMSTRYM